MIDFDTLLIGPAMATFARPITVTPCNSQPNAAPYQARGIWTVKNIDVQVEGDGVYSAQVRTLSVRLSEFAIPPVPGDQVAVAGATYVIDDTDDDSEGGSVWTLKQVGQ